MNQRTVSKRARAALCAGACMAVLLAGSLLAGDVTRADDAQAARSGKDRGPLFTMEFRDAELRDVLRAIGQMNNMNIIMTDDVSGKITLSFQKVPLLDAIDSILKIHRLTYYRDGSVIRVMKSPFPEGEESLVTRAVRVNYVSAQDATTTLKALLSQKGKITSDVRTNTVVIRDLEANVDRIEEILLKLDIRTPQVFIDTKIVEVTTNFARSLGIQWGGVPVQGPNAGKGSSAQASGDANNSNLFINLPVPSAPMLGQFQIGRVADALRLDIRLSALEDQGVARVLSNPRVLTLNNKEATVSSGTELLIPTTVLTGGVGVAPVPGGATGGSFVGGVTSIPVKLELKVTPTVTPDDRVLLHVKADKKDVDRSVASIQGVPPLTTRQAETDILVRNGETVVLGGILQETRTSRESRVPWMHSIPVLGWLFKRQAVTTDTTELMIFLTPTVTEEPETVARGPAGG
jgi:type IV pilus assembly protein PilQ